MEAGAVPRVAPPTVPALTPRLLRLASDARLVGLVRDGRPGAFEAIYDRHHRGIYAFCRHMLGDADEAEDAVQHTFMAAYSDLRRSDRPVHVKAWLFTIARNRCYTILRSRREQPAAELEEPLTEGVATQAQRRQDLRDLVRDMRQLPEDQRAALVLAELDALSHAEIADVLCVPKEKVKALVFQARESLVASRTARDTACAEIREQIACGKGAALRRANLRRHLRDCDGCRAFRSEVERQRKRFGALLPFGPTLALKEAVLGATAAGGGAAAIGGGMLAGGALKGGLVKGIVALVVTSAGTAGTLVIATTTSLHPASILRAVTGTVAPAARHSSGHRPARASSTRALSASAGASHATGSVRARIAMVPVARPVRVSFDHHGRRSVVGRASARVRHLRWEGRHRRVHVVPLAPALAAAVPVVHVPPGLAGRVGYAGAPGHSGFAPGHARVAFAVRGAPGHSGWAPGHSGWAPGHSERAPGHSGWPPGLARIAASRGLGGRNPTAPGHSGFAPGHSGFAPGHWRGGPGRFGGPGHGHGPHGAP